MQATFRRLSVRSRHSRLGGDRFQFFRESIEDFEEGHVVPGRSGGAQLLDEGKRAAFGFSERDLEARAHELDDTTAARRARDTREPRFADELTQLRRDAHSKTERVILGHLMHQGSQHHGDRREGFIEAQPDAGLNVLGKRAIRDHDGGSLQPLCYVTLITMRNLTRALILALLCGGASGCVGASVGVKPDASVGDMPSAGPVGRTMKAHSAKFAACGRDSVTVQIGTKQHLTLRFTVDPEGNVKKPRIDDMTEGDPDLYSCVLRVLKRMKFPPPPDGQAKPIVYPLVVRPE